MTDITASFDLTHFIAGWISQRLTIILVCVCVLADGGQS